MKIIFDYSIFLIQEIGGISRYFVELSRNIRNLNCNVKIVSPIYASSLLNEIKKDHIAYLKIKKIPKYCTKLFNKINFNFNNYYIKLNKPNIIHKTYFSNSDYESLKAKKIINVWDLTHETFYQDYKKDKNWRPKENDLKNSDHIICSSEKTKKDLLNFYNLNKEKISVVYQGVYKKDNINHNIRNNEILFVGERGKYKNFKNLLKAISISSFLKNNFKLVCFGNEKKTIDEDSLIKELGLSFESIIFISGNDHLLSEYYKKSCALVYPSKNEGFGFPPLEAMSYGCPVITSNNEAIIEATGMKQFSFDPNSIEEMSKVIEDTLNSSEKIQFMKDYGLQRINNFSWAKTAKEIIDIYKK